MSFISPIGSQLERFLAHRRGLGVAYAREAAFLRELDRRAAAGTDRTLSETLVRRYLAGASQDGCYDARQLRVKHARLLRFGNSGRASASRAL